tara:strand:+ start:909 stop:1082 length:174 start_codon:yes stop_codon:yes gene_type:complete
MNLYKSGISSTREYRSKAKLRYTLYFPVIEFLIEAKATLRRTGIIPREYFGLLGLKK